MRSPDRLRPGRQTWRPPFVVPPLGGPDPRFMERTRRLHLGVEETGCHVCPDWPMTLQVDSLRGGSGIKVIMNVGSATFRKRSESRCPGTRLHPSTGLWLAGLMVVIMGFGCRRAPTSVPAAPPNAIEAIVEGMRNHQPQVVWHALPPRMRRQNWNMAAMEAGPGPGNSNPTSPSRTAAPAPFPSAGRSTR